MPRPNYHQQVRKQKELARRARQDEKQQRRSARVNTAETSAAGVPTEAAEARQPDAETPS